MTEDKKIYNFTTENLSVDSEFTFYHTVWACKFYCNDVNKRQLTLTCLKELQVAEFSDPNKSTHLLQFLQKTYCLQSNSPEITYASEGVEISFKKEYEMLLVAGPCKIYIIDKKFAFMQTLKLAIKETRTFQLSFLIFYLKFLADVIFSHTF